MAWLGPILPRQAAVPQEAKILQHGAQDLREREVWSPESHHISAPSVLGWGWGLGDAEQGWHMRHSMGPPGSVWNQCHLSLAAHTLQALAPGGYAAIAGEPIPLAARFPPPVRVGEIAASADHATEQQQIQAGLRHGTLGCNAMHMQVGDAGTQVRAVPAALTPCCVSWYEWQAHAPVYAPCAPCHSRWFSCHAHSRKRTCSRAGRASARGVRVCSCRNLMCAGQ